MDSRRTTSNSSGNGRSSGGNNVNGKYRPGGCSYLSNVRPENRSTLCSVMAQLTEETQPSFETTLKSRSVSENCTVKFSCVVSGYPAPQITWYKDDLQLDRYCGLPKYEIFRNGRNHSLHIYNCTVEDAAIYQASAINSKGIVSCSGVLEVGEMNEFKIHQRYFANLKQKAENKRKEVEGKENQEPLRTISPARTQLKRRSTMEAFISTPGSLEDEGNKERNQVVASETETGLEVVSVEDGKESLVPMVNGINPALTNSQAMSNIDNKSDTSQKISITHQHKSPFVKKKIKISSDAKVTTPWSLKEEKISKEEASPTGAPGCTQETKYKKIPQEFVEVETIKNSSIMDSKTKIDKNKSLAKDEDLPPESSSKDEDMCPESSVSLQKEQTFPSSKPPAIFMSARPAVQATESKKLSNNVREARHKDAKGKFLFKTQNKLPCNIPTQPQANVTSKNHSTLKVNINANDHDTDTDVDTEPKASSDKPVGLKRSEPVLPPCDNRAALPQRLCETAMDQSPEWKTSPCQKKGPVSQSTTPAEVVQAIAKKNKNDAPVCLEIQPPRQTLISQLGQKTVTERETPTSETPTSSLHSGFKANIEKLRKDKREHSSKSSEMHTARFEHLKKPIIESPGEGEKTQGCSISRKDLQYKVDIAIQTTEREKIHVDEKVEKKEEATLLVQNVRAMPNEKIGVMVTEHAALDITKLTQKTNNKNIIDLVVPVSKKETDKDRSVSKRVDSSEICHMELERVETSLPIHQKTTANLNTLENIVDPQEKSNSAKKMISIAELLRSQIKALESSLVNSKLILPSQANKIHEPTSPVTGRCIDTEENRLKSKNEETFSADDRKTQTRNEDISPKNIKATLMEIYKLNLNDQEQIHYKEANFQFNETLPQLHTIPTTTIDSGINVGTKSHPETAKEYDECVKERTPKSSTLITCKDCSVPNTLVTTKLPSIYNLSEPENQKSLVFETNTDDAIQELKPTTKDSDIGSIEKLYPELPNSQIEQCNTEKNVTPNSELCKKEEHDCKTKASLHPLDCSIQNEIIIYKTEQLLHNNSENKSDPNISLISEPSRVLKRRSSTSPIPSATPEELATGARRKILTPKGKPEEVPEVKSPTHPLIEKKELPTQSCTLSATLTPPSLSPNLARKSPVLQPADELSPNVEQRSPILTKRKTLLEKQTLKLERDEHHSEGKPAKNANRNPFKAPQVIRKIRGETFGDASGHLKLWCQFFNVLSDSVIKWSRNEEEIAQTKRSAADETPVNLAIVQASFRDSGVYGCSITNEYGSDSTDILLSTDILTGFSLREELAIGEEIEMTTLMFSRGVADSGAWSNKFFGRIMIKETHIGVGFSRKVWRAKVIYGLEPVFESGNVCIIKVRNPIAYGGKKESCLIERNLEIVKQDCKIQNLAREYCKIFSAESKVIENFGKCLEVIPVHLMYRPENTIPYATVESDLIGVYQKYSVLDQAGTMDLKSCSEVEQKCCALQHWIFQWTNGNLLFTRLEGVDMKITNVGISVRSTGYQGLSIEGNPNVFELFISLHKCNYYCGLLSLRSLKVMDSLMMPSKPKGSKSPLLQQKMASGSSSPQSSRKAGGSPRVPRKLEQDGNKVAARPKTADPAKETNIVE